MKYYVGFGIGILLLSFVFVKGVKSDGRNEIPGNENDNSNEDGYYRQAGKLYIKKETLARIIEDIYDDYSSRFIPFDKELIMAIVWQESSFWVNARGDGGNSLGLMQISEIAFRQVKQKYFNLVYGINYSDIMNVKTNLKVGILYLHWIYNTGKVGYQNWAKLYAIYNGGFDYPNISYARGLEVQNKYEILKRGGY